MITPYKGKALCIECHRKAVKAKAVIGKDNAQHAYLTSADEGHLLEAADTYYAMKASVQAIDDEWESVRMEAYQANQAEVDGVDSLSQTDTGKDIFTMHRDSLAEMYKQAMDEGAANAAKATEETITPKRSASQMLPNSTSHKRAKTESEAPSLRKALQAQALMLK